MLCKGGWVQVKVLRRAGEVVGRQKRPEAVRVMGLGWFGWCWSLLKTRCVDIRAKRDAVERGLGEVEDGEVLVVVPVVVVQVDGFGLVRLVLESLEYQVD